MLVGVVVGLVVGVFVVLLILSQKNASTKKFHRKKSKKGP